MLWIVTEKTDEGNNYYPYDDDQRDNALWFADQLREQGSEASIDRYGLADEFELEFEKKYNEAMEMPIDPEVSRLTDENGKLREEVRIARSDVRTLEEVIVKMAMRSVGM